MSVIAPISNFLAITISQLKFGPLKICTVSCIYLEYHIAEEELHNCWGWDGWVFYWLDGKQNYVALDNLFGLVLLSQIIN